MAKAGMRRPNPKDPHGENPERMNIPKNEGMKPVPEIKGKKKGHKKTK